jgi:hypothetical protein
MKKLEIVIRRFFFFGSFALGLLAALEKLTNIFHGSLMGPSYPPQKLMEIAAVGLLFAIVMQLHAIRLLLSQKPAEPPR